MQLCVSVWSQIVDRKNSMKRDTNNVQTVMENGRYKHDKMKQKEEEVAELIRRFRTLRTVYNECARAVEVHCHQITFWSENVVPSMTDVEIASQSSLEKDELLPSSLTRKHLLALLTLLKEELSVYYDKLLSLKKAFDRLYYTKTSKKDISGLQEIQRGYCAIDEGLRELVGVRFVPCDSLLWNPVGGQLGKLEEFTIVVYDPPGEPEKHLEESHLHFSIKSPMSLVRTIFKKPLSVFSQRQQGSNLFKSKSVPKLHRL